MQEEIKVTNLGKCYGIRYFVDGILRSEYRCEYQQDIGFAARELLRWEDKLGKTTAFTSSARRRQNKSKQPIGKIWKYFNE